MTILTDFQRQCEEALGVRLRESGIVAIQRTIAGGSEKFVQVSVADFTVYIYLDEAGIQGPGIDDRFERPDYRDLDALCTAFVDRVLQLGSERGGTGDRD